MKIYIKSTYILSFITILSLVGLAVSNKVNTAFAQDGYRGVIVSKPKTEDDKKDLKKVYKGLISEKTYNYNNKQKPKTDSKETESNTRKIFKSRYQRIREEKAKNNKIMRDTRERLNALSGKKVKSVEEMRKEALLREKEYKKLVKENPDLLKQENYMYPIKKEKPPQTGDINYPKHREKYSKFDGLEDIDLEVMKKDYSRLTIEKAILDNVTLPPIMIRSLATMADKEMKEGGESSTEKSGRLEIEKYFNILKKSKNAPIKKKKEIFEKVEKHLDAMEIRYQFERDIPDRILSKMGLPPKYIEKQQRELDSVLSMISSAKKELKRYKKKL